MFMKASLLGGCWHRKVLCVVVVMLANKPRALGTLGKCFTTLVLTPEN